MAARRRPPERHPNAARYLSREAKIAHVICGAIHSAGCSCENGSAATCHTMIWAAQRVIRHLAEEGQVQ